MRKIPLKFQLALLASFFFLIAFFLSLLRFLLYYEGPYKSYISSALSFASSAMAYTTKRVLDKALEPYRAL